MPEFFLHHSDWAGFLKDVVVSVSAKRSATLSDVNEEEPVVFKGGPFIDLADSPYTSISPDGSHRILRVIRSQLENRFL